MWSGPPFRDQPDDDWTLEDVGENVQCLDYEGRDIRTFETGVPGSRPGKKFTHVVDFDPNKDDPDPDVWPIEEVDPGYPAPVDDLYLEIEDWPKPGVRWVTYEYAGKRYPTQNPYSEGIKKAVREHKRSLESKCNMKATEYMRDGYERDKALELARKEVYGPRNNAISYTEDQLEALRRIARLWNGEYVQGFHLLRDKCPAWMELLGDLDQGELKRLLVDPDVDIHTYRKFERHDWYDEDATILLSPQHVAQKKVYYAPTQKGRTVLNEFDNLPSLKGDQFERLRHRFGVGMGALWLASEVDNSGQIKTYPKFSSSMRADFWLEPNGDSTKWGTKPVIGEMITHHHDRDNWLRTGEKLWEYSMNDCHPIIITGKRKTAYDIFRYWLRNSKLSLPGSGFKSNWNITKAREKIHEAYNDPDHMWPIADWSTSTKLWRELLADDNEPLPVTLPDW
jgi:hypothetical protein